MPDQDRMTRLLALLDLEVIEHNLFRGNSPQTGWQRVFGGQVIAQALVAAQRTVSPERHVHSLHCYFMLAGDPSVPIVYQVERLRDGGSFSTRRVTAIQHGNAIFSLEASFQIDEPGLEHQIPMPMDVPQPEGLRDQMSLLQENAARFPESIGRLWARERPLDVRPIHAEHYSSREKLPPQQRVWMRAIGVAPDDRRLRCAILAYLSDMTLLDTSTFAHGRQGFEADIQMASLDHAMWFHRDHPLDDWLLYVQDSPSTRGARGFTRGLLYGRDGTLIASVAQEGLVRLRTRDKK
jgi:acyl-CoA thioesterase-2